MYTIKEVAEITETNEHTIRYYAKLGLFPHISRDEYNSRVFTDSDIDDVRLVIMLADTGMSLKEVKEFMDLEGKGNETLAQRVEILSKHQMYARSKMYKLQKQVQLLEWKTYQYQEKLRDQKK